MTISAPSNQFTTTDEHWACVSAFLSAKANEDEISNDAEKLDLIRQFFLLIEDRELLENECDVMALELLEDVKTKQIDSAAKRDAEIVRLKKKKKKKRKTKRKPPPPELKPPTTTNEDHRAATRTSKRPKPPTELEDET